MDRMLFDIYGTDYPQGEITHASRLGEAVHERCEESAQKDATATPAELMQLVIDQGYRCALSGREITPDCSALDHIVPASEGGTHTIDNLWWLHAEVNRAKGTMSVKDFTEMCEEVASYKAPTFEPS